MRAAIFKIITDYEGESKITFSIPSSELVDVVKLQTYLQKELDIDIKEAGIKESV